MSIRCLNCSYEIKTCQEFISTATHIEADSWEEMKDLLKRASENQIVSELLRVILQSPSDSPNSCHDLADEVKNMMSDDSLKVKCPKCGDDSQWEDI